MKAFCIVAFLWGNDGDNRFRSEKRFNLWCEAEAKLTGERFGRLRGWLIGLYS
jgi:hypothetical protein